MNTMTGSNILFSAVLKTIKISPKEAIAFENTDQSIIWKEDVLPKFADPRVQSKKSYTWKEVFEAWKTTTSKQDLQRSGDNSMLDYFWYRRSNEGITVVLIDGDTVEKKNKILEDYKKTRNPEGYRNLNFMKEFLKQDRFKEGALKQLKLNWIAAGQKVTGYHQDYFKAQYDKLKPEDRITLDDLLKEHAKEELLYPKLIALLDGTKFAPLPQKK